MQIDFPVDVGETVYLYDEETKLIYPMMVYDIRKNRTSNFKFMLVSTEYEWDNKFSAIVGLDSYNITWFKSQSEAEEKYYTNIALDDLTEVVAKMTMLFDKLKYKDITIKGTDTKVKFQSYNYLSQTLTFCDISGNGIQVPISNVMNLINIK